MFGILILIIGLFFLLKNLGFITGDAWSIFWPLLLIAIGLKFLIMKKHRHWSDWQRFGEKMHDKFHDGEHHERKEE